MSEKEKLLKALKNNINLSGFLNEIIDELLEVSLKKVVADSSNPFGDIAMNAMWPVLEKYLKEEIKKLEDKIYDVN